jgi:hypothetical protein
MTIAPYRSVIVIFALIAIILILPAGEAAEVNGINFNDAYVAGATVLKIRGAGVLRVMAFVKVYAGVFYLPDNTPSNMVLDDVPKRLEVEYFRSIAGHEFGLVTHKKISENVDPQTYERLRPRIEYHNTMYQDVQPGDRYSLTYIPGKGTELALNGVSKGVVQGADFAAALFSIWLGPKPISESFKKDLLNL